MQHGIKDYHIRKFSRLVQELDSLLKDIRAYCPDAVYRLNTSEFLELGIHGKDCEDDYPYIISERLSCDDINDVGRASYCLDETAEAELHYCKDTDRSKSVHAWTKTKRIKKGTSAYFDEVHPYYIGYCASRVYHEPMSEEEFASEYLNIELVD